MLNTVAKNTFYFNVTLKHQAGTYFLKILSIFHTKQELKPIFGNFRGRNLRWSIDFKNLTNYSAHTMTAIN